jgi:thiol-disulfide isomerase/thioredoxin
MALTYALPRRIVRRRAALWGVVAAAGALTLSACSSGTQVSSASGSRYVTSSSGIATVAKASRVAAPDISGKTLEGAELDVNSAYKGKIVVLNVWGSWCSPCRAEAPNLAKVAKELKPKGVEFVGINTRDSSKGPATAFEKDFGVEYPSLYDPAGKLILRFPKGNLNPVAIPSTIVFDRDGKIAARKAAAMSEEDLHKMLDPLIAEK